MIFFLFSSESVGDGESAKAEGEKMDKKGRHFRMATPVHLAKKAFPLGMTSHPYKTIYGYI